MAEVRTRFAPSPTGYLHIGGVRTALYSWLFARRHGGKFVLRIEDTDKERNTPEAVQAIFDGLRWAGLTWDEGPDIGGPFGPYRQTERLALYGEYCERLLASGQAYRCYATQGDKENARAAFVAAGGKAEGFVFKSPWRERPAEQRAEPHVVRFRSPTEGATGWRDRVRGEVQIPNSELQDFVLMRSDGMPLYNFACVVDDMLMRITQVVRGEEHLINTAPQILMYRAFGVEPPEFAHCPVILAQNGQKLSKRHAAVSVKDYEEQGYLPDAMLNYLVRLGWSHGDQEIFTRSELIEKFDFEHVGAGGAKYDTKKLLAVQGEHLRLLEPARIAELGLSFVRARGLDVSADDPRLVPAFASVRIRASTLADAAERVDFYFREPPTFDEASVKKFLLPAVAPHLGKLAELAQSSEPFDELTLEARVNHWMESSGVPMKDFAQAARVALTGRGAAPGLFEIMAVLGREVSVRRLSQGQLRAERA
ncbi:MAG: Glutamyl-tRNA synthetase [Myxococcaceae bacterium]|nr:Glutamyl-tRNA synthetase [Myxococcaceae bacterium]